MSIVSIYFLIFLFISVIIFYLFPKKNRWIVLLISSIIFFIFASSWKLLFYLIFGVVTTYIGTNLMSEKCKTDKQRKIVMFLTLFSILGVLFLLKYINIFPLTLNAFSKLFSLDFKFGMLSFIAPLGISYYTLSLTGYVIDIYRKSYKPQKNIFKHCLFACYYPIMISGPFVRYNYMEKELFEAKKFNWDNIFLGFYRIIYGLMKKLVIADQLGIFVNAVFDNYTTYTGFYIIIAVILYAIQIYADFSGCMDIVYGASKMYGIDLLENFDSPFFSKNLSEFWRRWHISLGTWAKDYIMYPLLKSDLFQKLGKKCKKDFGKKAGKLIPTVLAILILWLLIGLWHGTSFRYIFAAGILPWIYLTLGQIFEDSIKRLTKKLHIKTDCFSFRLFQSLRTFGLMCIVWLIACSPSLLGSLDVINHIFVFFDTTIISELPQLPSKIILLCCILVLVVDYLNYKGINVFEKFKDQNIWFRWFILFALIIIILIFGAYGPGYDASEFIYGGF